MAGPEDPLVWLLKGSIGWPIILLESIRKVIIQNISYSVDLKYCEQCDTNFPPISSSAIFLYFAKNYKTKVSPTSESHSLPFISIKGGNQM